jgi:hypothetical protein
MQSASVRGTAAGCMNAQVECFSIYDKECAPDILRAIRYQLPHLRCKVTVVSGVTGEARAFVVKGNVSAEELNRVVQKVAEEIDYPCSRFTAGDSWPHISW